MNFKYNDYTIEQEDDNFIVFGHGEYPEDSVLAGQYARCAIDTFNTLEEASKAYPKASILERSTRIPSSWISMSDIPPSWFDPADAGERWNEDY